MSTPFSPKPTFRNGRYGVRSISMPVRSHPSSLKIQLELEKLRHWEEEEEGQSCFSPISSSDAAEVISSGLVDLGTLYICVQELADSPLTQQALSRSLHNGWLADLLDDSVTYLDICSRTRDSILALREDIQQLQSALRRRKVMECSSADSAIATFLHSCKCRKKEMRKMLAMLKRIEGKHGGVLDDNNSMEIVRVLHKASWITSLVLRSLLVFLAAPIGLKPKRQLFRGWSLVSKLVHRGVEVGHCCTKEWPDESAVFALADVLVSGKKAVVDDEYLIQSVHRRLKALDSGIGCVEDGVEHLFKGLIQTRVFILNILSHT